jgi:hypothetical protein
MQQNPTHDWIVVNEFGNSKCFVDRNSIKKIGDVARTLVKYSLDPPATDKRDNREVAAMINVEEYDLSKSTFQVKKIIFQYTDGTEIEAIGVGGWRPATGGNQRTLMFLRGPIQ